jgi:type I restriction enzyme M protein
VRADHARGATGRFGPGLPRISDGQLLFLLHMLAHAKDPKDGGSRIAIIMNGSPLFTGDAGGGESEIRRWILEHDWLETIVALPGELFYNTGISTYIWVLSNRKPARRTGKVLLVNGAAVQRSADGVETTRFARRMRRSLGEKRNELAPEQIAELARLAGEFDDGPYTRVFETTEFGYRKITVERPLRLNFQASPERIARLPAEQRDVYLLHEESDLSLEEIARVTGVGAETAKSRLRYAVNKLKAALSVAEA